MTHAFPDYYQFAHPTRVVAGRGMIEGVGFEFMKEGAKRPLIVTDQVIRETGLAARSRPASRRRARGHRGLRRRPAGLLDRHRRGLRAGGEGGGADSFVAVGGGSVMDTAKAANAVFSHGGSALDYEGIYTLPREDDGLGAPLPVAPFACIPTTAGTGSEVSFGAVIKDPEQQIKLLIGDFLSSPRDPRPSPPRRSRRRSLRRPEWTR